MVSLRSGCLVVALAALSSTVSAAPALHHRDASPAVHARDPSRAVYERVAAAASKSVGVNARSGGRRDTPKLSMYERVQEEYDLADDKRATYEWEDWYHDESLAKANIRSGGTPPPPRDESRRRISGGQDPALRHDAL